MSAALRIFLLDDEALARSRLRELLSDIALQLPTDVVGEADSAPQALDLLARLNVDVVLADVRMPGMDGISFASRLSLLPHCPAVIFTTAYDHYAVQAFDLNAVDYLLKPVRAQRLLTALRKVPRRDQGEDLSVSIPLPLTSGRTLLSCHERGRLLLVPVGEVLYFKADQKYVAARTLEKTYLLDESLAQLESEFASQFLRLHRSVLVARSALIGMEKAANDEAEAYGWALLKGVDEKLPVSRRHWSGVRELLQGR